MSLRWNIPFKSLAGVSCRIEIYDDSYTGSTVVLSRTNPTAPAYAAATPITLEEDSNSDTLEVIRPVTGYINLVELEYGALDAMYPTENEERTVKLYYGNSLVFQGYIQAQDYDRDWGARPALVSIPIASPLMYASSHRFSNITFTEGNVMLGNLLKEIATAFGYSMVFFPSTLVSRTAGSAEIPLHLYTYPRHVCPYSDDYRHGFGDLYAPITYAEFLEGLCRLYGLIVHEVGIYLVFTRYDYSGSYNYYMTSNLDNESNTPATVSQDIIDIDAYTIADANGRDDHVLPIRRLRLNHGDYTDEVKMDFMHGRSAYWEDLNAVGSVVDTGANECYFLTDQTERFYAPNYIDHNPSTGQVNYVRTYGDASGESWVFYSIQINTGGATIMRRNRRIARYTFDDWPRRTYDHTNGTVKKSRIILELERKAPTSGSLVNDFNVLIECGGQALFATGVYAGSFHDFSWNSTDAADGAEFTIGTNWNNNKFQIEFNNPDAPITVWLLSSTASSLDGTWQGSMKMSLKNKEVTMQRYLQNQTNTERTLEGNVSNEEASLSLLFHYDKYIFNGNRLHNDSAVSDYTITTEYPYLFVTQQRNTRTVKAPASFGATTWVMLYYGLLQSMSKSDWHLIATAFDVVNDNLTLITHRYDNTGQ